MRVLTLTINPNVIASHPRPHQCRDCNTLILAREAHIELPHGRYHLTCIIRIVEALQQ